MHALWYRPCRLFCYRSWTFHCLRVESPPSSSLIYGCCASTWPDPQEYALCIFATHSKSSRLCLFLVFNKYTVDFFASLWHYTWLLLHYLDLNPLGRLQIAFFLSLSLLRLSSTTPPIVFLSPGPFSSHPLSPFSYTLLLHGRKGFVSRLLIYFFDATNFRVHVTFREPWHLLPQESVRTMVFNYRTKSLWPHA